MKKQIKQKIPFVDCASNVPFVKFYIHGGEECYAILDSGSESTIFDMDFIKSHKKQFKTEITDNKVTLVGVGTAVERPIIDVSVDVTFDEAGISYPAKGHIVDLSTTKEHTKTKLGIETVAIFGGAFLKSIGAEINYPEKTLYLNDISGK